MTTETPTTVSRRTFVAGTGAAVAAAAVPSWIVGSATAAGAADLPLTSVGYLVGSRTIEDMSTLPWDDPAQAGATRRIVPATSMTSGDGGYATGLLAISVHRLHPVAGPTVQRASLDLLTPPPAGTTAELPVYAWTYRRSPHSESSTSRLTVSAPLVLELSVDLGTGPRRSRAAFTTGSEAGRPKLRRGIYLVGLGRTTWNANFTGTDAQLAARPDLASVVLVVDRA